MNKYIKYAIIFVAIALIIWVPQYSSLNSDIDREIEGCERLNITREYLYDMIVLFSELSAEDHSPESKEFAKLFTSQAKELEESIKPYQDEGTKHPVDVDCREAYPKPFPLSAFTE